MHRLAIATLLLAGCLGESTRQCENGATCAYDEVCTEVPLDSGEALCGSPRLVEACAKVDDFAACDFSTSGAKDGTCLGNVCTACTSVDVTGCTAAGWQKLTLPSTQSFTGVAVPSASQAFVVGANRTVAHYTGKNWDVSEIDALAASTQLAGVWAASPTSVFTAAYSGDIVEYAGGAWRTVFTTPSNLRSISGSGSTIVAVGQASTVVRYTGTWSMEQAMPAALLSGVWVADANNAIAVGPQGLILRYKDGAWTVDRAQAAQQPALTAVWGRSPTDIYAVGQADSMINIVHYEGGSWVRLALPLLPPVTLTGIYGAGDHVFMSGQQGTIVHFDGTTWSSRTISGERLDAIGGSAIDNIFAVGTNGAVYRYTGRD